jgi:transcriptional regulator with XRE-family HTH domain
MPYVSYAAIYFLFSPDFVSMKAVVRGDSSIVGAGESIGDRLRIIQNQLGIEKDVDFANLIGVSRSSLSEYFSGKQTPRPQVLRRIATKTNSDINWLAGKSVPPNQSISNPELFPFAEGPSILESETLDAPPNFYLLALSLQLCRAHYKKASDLQPTLRDALKWISGPYALRASIPDQQFAVTPKPTEDKSP